MLWFLFFCLLLGLGTAEGTHSPIVVSLVFIAWCVLVYYLAVNGYID